jgi:hypothetical protein
MAYALKDHDIAHVHDAVFDATGENLSNEEICALVKLLPSSITSVAEEWTYSDTVVRDDIYRFVQDRHGARRVLQGVERSAETGS